MKNKRAAMGEGILMVYRLLIVIIIAFVVLGCSAIFYDYSIDVRDSEAAIMGSQIVNCIAPLGVLNLNLISDNNKLFDFCKIKGVERYYVNVSVYDGASKISMLQGGDSGAAWVKQIYDSKSGTSSIAKYEPGYFEGSYDVVVLNKNNKINGNIAIEVYANSE
jgi:hypothetical protein